MCLDLHPSQRLIFDNTDVAKRSQVNTRQDDNGRQGHEKQPIKNENDETFSEESNSLIEVVGRSDDVSGRAFLYHFVLARLHMSLRPLLVRSYIRHCYRSLTEVQRHLGIEVSQ